MKNIARFLNCRGRTEYGICNMKFDGIWISREKYYPRFNNSGAGVMWAHRAFVRDVTLENSTRPRCTTAPSFSDKEDKPLFSTKFFFCVFENRVLLHVLFAILWYNQQDVDCTNTVFRVPPSTPQCFGNKDCSSTVLVERRVFGALRMATPRGGRGVTIGPDTCHSDFIFVSSNFWNTHFLPLLHWKSPGTMLGLHFSVDSKMDPFQASQIYPTTENRLDGTHKIWVRQDKVEMSQTWIKL